MSLDGTLSINYSSDINPYAQTGPLSKFHYPLGRSQTLWIFTDHLTRLSAKGTSLCHEEGVHQTARVINTYWNEITREQGSDCCEVSAFPSDQSFPKIYGQTASRTLEAFQRRHSKTLRKNCSCEKKTNKD